MPAVDVAPDALESLTPAARRRAMKRITIAWLFGAIWANALAGAPLTLFAKQLGATNFEFGLLAAMPFFAALLSLPASLLADRSGRRSLLFFLGLYPNRLLWVVIAVVPPMLFHHYGSALAVAVFLSLVFVINVGQAVGSPGWVSWMADIVPPSVRGRYFATRRQVGILSAVPTSLAAGWVLDYYRMADGQTILTVCSVIFCVAAVFGLCDIGSFHFVPHAVRKNPRESIARTFARPLRNPRFVWFSLGASILWFAVAGQGQFVNKFLVDRMNLQSTQVQLIVLVGPMLTQLIVLPIWGRTIDRFGKKPAMLIAIIGLIPVGSGWVLIAEHHVWAAYMLAICGSVLWTGVDIANFNLTIELSGTDAEGRSGGTAYTAVNSVLLNVAGCCGGLFFGYIAERFATTRVNIGLASPVGYYGIIFGISATLRLIAILPLLKMHEPEAEPTRDALRFMVGSLYNNVVGAVTSPARLVFRRTGPEPDDE